MGVGVVLNAGINFVIDYYMNRDYLPLALVASQTFLAHLVLVVIISVVTFITGTLSAWKSFGDGAATPVVPEALSDAKWKRALFFSWAEPDWKVRLPLYLAQCLVCPGVAVFTVESFVCWVKSGATAEDECVTDDIWTFMGVAVATKAVSMAAVTALHWPAAHNMAQPHMRRVVEQRREEQNTAPTEMPKEGSHTPRASYIAASDDTTPV